MKHNKQPGTKDMLRPYERCLVLGASSLSDAELIAVILRCGTAGTDAVTLGGQVLSLAKGEEGLLGLCRLTIPELMKLPGIGEVKAIQLTCVGELSKRIAASRARHNLSFQNPESIAEYYMELLRHEKQEVLYAVMLDAKMNRISEEVITRGTIRASLMSPREIFQEALRVNACFIVLLHNHPSGDPTPSRADIEATARVIEAGELMDVPLVDHIIIGDRQYCSIRSDGFLEDWN